MANTKRKPRSTKTGYDPLYIDKAFGQYVVSSDDPLKVYGERLKQASLTRGIIIGDFEIPTIDFAVIVDQFLAGILTHTKYNFISKTPISIVLLMHTDEDFMQLYNRFPLFPWDLRAMMYTQLNNITACVPIRTGEEVNFIHTYQPGYLAVTAGEAIVNYPNVHPAISSLSFKTKEIVVDVSRATNPDELLEVASMYKELTCPPNLNKQ